MKEIRSTRSMTRVPGSRDLKDPLKFTRISALTNGVASAFSATSRWTKMAALIGAISLANSTMALTSEDIGGPSIAGSYSESGGTHTIQASGSDIWNSSDEFRYSYVPMTGDGEAIARVQSIGYVHQYSKGGVMMRESLAANSKHATTLVHANGLIAFQRRAATGDSSSYTNGGYALPTWVRLVRSGDTFTSYSSSNGTSWTQIGSSVTISMSSTIYVGLALTSHDNSSLTTGVFDNVSLPGADETVLFSDDFNDGNANGWTTSGGSWSVNSNEYLNTGSGWSLTGNTAWDDYSVQGDVYAIDSTYPGIYGRVTDTNNAYHLEINVPNQQVQLWKRVSGTWTQLDTYNTTINQNTWYTLKLMMSGSSLIGYFNDSPVVSATDTSFSSGKIGLRSGNDSRFDNIIVTEPGIAGPIIAEDFSSSASNFTAVAGGTWSVSSGRYVLTNPATGSTAGVLGNISVHNTSLTGDYVVTALMNITGTSSAWNDAAIVFGYQDLNNYYYVSLNESNDSYTKGLIKVVSGVPTELADISMTVVSGTDYPVQIQRTGNAIVVLVNSTQVASVTDATFSGGLVGFGTYNDGAQFDDLVVTGAADAIAPSVPTGLVSSNVTQTTVDLDWNTSSDGVGVTGYNLYTGGSNPTSVGNVTSITVTQLSPGTNYSFSVSAYDAAGNESAQSSPPVSVTTSAGSSQVAAPQFSPGGGTYSSAQSVTITSTTSGSTIRYTTNGSTPTSTSGTVYSSPVSIASTATLKAIAYKSGMTDSAVTTATYSITTGSGFPTPSTTGPSGTLTSYSGTLTTTSDGQLIENLDISGGIKVNHKNVTIRNCRFSGLDIATSTPTTGQNCVVEDSELGWAGRQNFTLRRCYMETFADDLIRIGGGNVVIEDCYLLITGPRPADNHTDIIQVYPVADYDNLVVNHNTMLNECNATSCINGPNMTITNNLMAGGSKAIYTSRSTITNNRFSTVYFPAVGSNGIFYPGNTDNVCSGNVIDETGAAVTCP